MKLPNCTWKDPEPGGRCQAPAKHVRRDDGGVPWANLCEAHHREIEESLTPPTGKTTIEEDKAKAARILRAWVRASGGASTLAKRITGDWS